MTDKLSNKVKEVINKYETITGEARRKTLETLLTSVSKHQEISFDKNLKVTKTLEDYISEFPVPVWEINYKNKPIAPPGTTYKRRWQN